MGTRTGTERQGLEQRNRDGEIETQKKEQGRSERDNSIYCGTEGQGQRDRDKRRGMGGIEKSEVKEE